MNRQESAWKRFEQTGCIADYLAYCRITAQGRPETEGDLRYADFDRWHCSENKTVGK